MCLNIAPVRRILKWTDDIRKRVNLVFRDLIVFDKPMSQSGS